MFFVLIRAEIGPTTVALASYKTNFPLAPKRKDAISQRSFYAQGVPNIDVTTLSGRLIVVEGADGSGRSTQIDRLVEWLEARKEWSRRDGVRVH